MEQRGERVREGGWTNKEHCVFVHSLKFVEENETATVKKLHHVYNSLVQLINQRTDLANIYLAKKSEKEIAAKYTHHCKEAALIQSLLK